MYKKFLAGAAALIMVMGASVCPVISAVDNFTITASADVQKSDGKLYYQIIRGGREIEILGAVNTKTETVNIPAKIEGLPVTEIAGEAFYNPDHDKYNYLKTVTLPDTIVEIKDSAFAYNGNLTSITIPASVKTIGASVFEGCKKLSSVKTSEGLESIGDNAFFWCEKLPSIQLPRSVKSIGENVFYNCATKVKGSDFVINCYFNTVSENYAFDNHIAYELLDADKSKTTLVDNGIYNKQFRYKLINNGKEISVAKGRLSEETMEIPSKISGVPITEIGTNAFYNDEHEKTNNLKKVVLPNSIKKICDGAFADNEALTSINIPSSVISIGNNAFEVCKSLEKITLPEGLQTIGAQAFTWCQSLTAVTIPASVTRIGEKAFFYCGTITGSENFFITCYKGTAGEKYAVDNKIEHKTISASKTPKGDINGDGNVNINDLTKLAAHIKGKKLLSDAKVGDINGDGKVNINDLTQLAAHIKGKRILK